MPVISTKILKEKLAIISPAVMTGKSTINTLRCVIIGDGWLQAYDGSLCIRTNVEINVPEPIAVNAKALSGFVDLAGEEIDFTFTPTSVELKSGKSKLSLNLETEAIMMVDWPSIGREDTLVFDDISSQLTHLLKLVTDNGVQSQEETGVTIIPTDDATLLVSTNRQALCCFRTQPVGEAHHVVLPPSFCKIIAKYTKDVTLILGDEYVWAQLPDGTDVLSPLTHVENPIDVEAILERARDIPRQSVKSDLRDAFARSAALVDKVADSSKIATNLTVQDGTLTVSTNYTYGRVHDEIEWKAEDVTAQFDATNLNRGLEYGTKHKLGFTDNLMIVVGKDYTYVLAGMQ